VTWQNSYIQLRASNRTVARKLSIGGLYVRAGGAWHSNLTKIPLIYSVPYFNLGGVGAFFGGISPQKPSPWQRDWLQNHFLQNHLLKGVTCHSTLVKDTLCRNNVRCPYLPELEKPVLAPSKEGTPSVQNEPNSALASSKRSSKTLKFKYESL